MKREMEEEKGRALRAPEGSRGGAGSILLKCLRTVITLILSMI